MTTTDIKRLTRVAQDGRTTRKALRASIDAFAGWACDNLIEGECYGDLRVIYRQSNVDGRHFLKIGDIGFAEAGEGYYLHRDFSAWVDGIAERELTRAAKIIASELETLEKKIEEKTKVDKDLSLALAKGVK